MKFVKVIKSKNMEQREKYICKWVDYDNRSHSFSFMAKNDLDACRKILDKVYNCYDWEDINEVTEEEILEEYPRTITEYKRYFKENAEEDYVKEISTASGRVVFKWKGISTLYYDSGWR